MINRLGHRLEDYLAPGEPQYRSRGEVQLGRLLDRYGIPFIYEQPTPVDYCGRRYVLYPDFTLRYSPHVIEYAGMPDRPEYMRRLRFKRRAYAANAIPALFVFPRDLTGPAWPHRLIERIRDPGAYARHNRYSGTWMVPRGF